MLNLNTWQVLPNHLIQSSIFCEHEFSIPQLSLEKIDQDRLVSSSLHRQNKKGQNQYLTFSIIPSLHYCHISYKYFPHSYFVTHHACLFWGAEGLAQGLVPASQALHPELHPSFIPLPPFSSLPWGLWPSFPSSFCTGF